MDQIHKLFTTEQTKVLFQGYCQGTIGRTAIEETLSIGKTRLFALLKDYRQNPQVFFLSYQRATPAKLAAHAESEIEKELLREKELVEDKRLPIPGYNYSALRDRISKKGIEVSVTTIIQRAKSLDCYKPRELLPGFGAKLAIDSTDILAYSNGHRAHPSDQSARWGAKKKSNSQC
jgi:hypothetical protein